MKDELFEKLNNLETDKENLLGLAITGFTHIERIKKLIIYGDVRAIEVECNDYFKKLEDALGDLENKKNS